MLMTIFNCEVHSIRRKKQRDHTSVVFVSKEKKKVGKFSAMGRPPCCDNVGIKKGPWTPEEDIILVSYIQEHGPGNWRSVPTNTGLMRCSKSCRLRWTNYLRPGIKRGSFTPHEEGMIIHLQAILGNKWAAIASYLPQRTDNDIKNFWNTHLKKKLKKFQSALEPQITSSDSTTNIQLLPKSPFSDQRSCLDFTNNQLGSSIRANQCTNNNSTTYASNTENISRLLEGWMRSSSNSKSSSTTNNLKEYRHKSHEIGNSSAMDPLRLCQRKNEIDQGRDLVSHEEFDSILSFDQNTNNNNNVTSWERSSGDSSIQNYKRGCYENSTVDHEINYEIKDHHVEEIEKDSINNVSTPPMSCIEKWLLDESTCAGHVEELMELSPMF